MRKVGIITLNGYHNYGNRLQNYATQEVLKYLGFTADTLVNKSEKKGSILAKEFPFSRIDFYNINGKIYLGEISFFPNNGFIKFKDRNMDRFFADKITIPPTNKNYSYSRGVSKTSRSW